MEGYVMFWISDIIFFFILCVYNLYLINLFLISYILKISSINYRKVLKENEKNDEEVI